MSIIDSRGELANNHQFTKTIFAKVEELGTRDEYINYQDDPEELAEVGESIRVGVYQLVRVEVITAPVARHPSWEKPPKRKKAA
jgi:hypothetical protein